MIPAKFGSKKFEVSSKKIYTPNGVSFSEELDIEETAVSGKKPKVNIKGVKLQGLSFDLKLDARFVDVETEIKFWKKTLLAKKSQPFTLGSTAIGQFFLIKVETSSIVINKSGKYTSASLTLSFTEDGAHVNNINDKKNATSNKKLTLKKGCVIRPKSGARWYYTAEGALKKTGKSGKAYQRDMMVTYTYSKNGKIVCVNPQGYGWLKAEDVTVVSSGSTQSSTTRTNTSSRTGGQLDFAAQSPTQSVATRALNQISKK